MSSKKNTYRQWLQFVGLKKEPPLAEPISSTQLSSASVTLSPKVNGPVQQNTTASPIGGAYSVSLHVSKSVSYAKYQRALTTGIFPFQARPFYHAGVSKKQDMLVYYLAKVARSRSPRIALNNGSDRSVVASYNDSYCSDQQAVIDWIEEARLLARQELVES